MDFFYDSIPTILYSADMFIFFNMLLGKRRFKYNFILDIFIICCLELLQDFIILPMTGDVSVGSTILRTLISFIVTITISLLFNSKPAWRLCTTIFFLVITMLCENIAFTTINNLLPINIQNDLIADSVFNSVSSLSDFYCLIFVLLLTLIFKRRHIKLSTVDITALLIVPTVSLIISITPGIFEINKVRPRSYSNLVNLLLAMNIVNFFLINEISKKEELQFQAEQLSRQIEFQQDKYVQLGESYKKLRSFIHDTQKHYTYIQNCIDSQNYDKIIPYTNEALNDLQSRYCTENTGNLVIDSFVSNLREVAGKYNISFSSSLRLDVNDIPISDYDLTIILGNLFDNAINACKSIENSNISLKLQMVSNTFTIHIENTYDKSAKQTSDTELDFIHGYGLENVKNAVAKYKGFCVINPGENTYSVTCVIPISHTNKKI